MRRREFALLVAPSMIVMFGLLVVPLYRTVQWSFQEVQYGAQASSSACRTTPLR